MKPPLFVVSSTGRSGSKYISEVLTLAGLRTGHQKWFISPALNRAKQSYTGESSCFSVPHLKSYKGVVIHQVRNPLHVLTSFWANRERIQQVGEVWAFRQWFMYNPTGDLMKDFMAMIVNMNQEIEEHAVYRWQVEKLHVSDIATVAQGIDSPIRHKDAKEAIGSVSSTLNKHHDSDYLTWGDLPNCIQKQNLKSQAMRYGYE